MKPTIAQFLKVKDFPFIIKDKNGNMIYHENSKGFWNKREYNDQGNEIYVERSDGFWYKSDYKNGKEIYFEDSNGYWSKYEYDEKGNEIYCRNSNGYWSKREYDAQGNETYYESSDGTVIDNRPKTVEMTLQDIADKLGMDVKTIRIKE
jgi:hypothetical protein